MTLHDKLRSLYPDAKPHFDFIVADHGDGVPVIDYWNADKLGPLPTMAQIEAAVPPVPRVVGPAQAKLALYNAGLLDEVAGRLHAAGYRPMKIFFDSASEWDRSHPYLLGLAAEMDLTDAQIDELFRQAAAL